MLAAGVNVAVGTDSRASSPDLNPADDLRLLHRLAPDVPALTLWELVTTRAARALGLEHEAGSIIPGKRPDLVVFPTNADAPLTDVLESSVIPTVVWAGERAGAHPGRVISTLLEGTTTLMLSPTRTTPSSSTSARSPPRPFMAS